MNIIDNIINVKTNTPNATLVVVTKYQKLSDISIAYAFGERNFGENKVQEILKKKTMLPNDIKWHMIGHLQKNKVKLIAPFIYMIQSVDSLELLQIINKQAKLNNRKIKCLIQYKIAKEKEKYGLNKSNIIKLFKSGLIKEYKNIEIAGLMGMASFTTNIKDIKSEFQDIYELYSQLKIKPKTLSIGMSNDYKTAYQNGSTMIRIGSAIFK